MLYLLEKEIDLQNSKILFEDDFSDINLSKNWDIGRGDWKVNEGWLEGSYPENGGGLIYSKQSFDCWVMMDFEARTVPPSCNDLNFSWNSEGWDAKANDAGVGYIAGIGGWYENKTGIERYPECDIRSMTQAFQLEAGKTYHVQAGSINGHCFIFANSKLIIEVDDPNPIDTSKYGKVGLGVYASRIQFRNLKVYEINWRKRVQAY